MGVDETSIKWRIAFFIQFVGFILMIAAVASTYVATADIIPNKQQHIGFWDICDDTQTYSCRDMVEYLNSLNRDPDWVHGCRAMVVLCVIIQGGTLIISLWMAYMASGVHLGNLITAGADFLSVIIGLIGGLVYLTNSMDVLEETLEMDSDPSWTFALLIISQGFFLIAGAIQILEACRTT